MTRAKYLLTFVDFYANLGSKRLSSLITNELEKGEEVQDDYLCREIKARIVDRLPLFLHENVHTSMVHDRDWLKEDDNFIVKKCASLSIKKSIKIKLSKYTRTKPTYATVEKAPGDGKLTLWIAPPPQTLPQSDDSEMFYE